MAQIKPKNVLTWSYTRPCSGSRTVLANKIKSTPMINLNDSIIKKIETILKNSGYTSYSTKQYKRFNRERGDSVFIHHSKNIIRCTRKTEAFDILQREFGNPNGKESLEAEERNASWFFNGYTGKSGTTT
ncbi:hypothetical protein BGP_2609 [Beggiatoa sp. PS]|nr:hypothetical protein BGP_2609 [Beggiatoa sp. PS]